MGQARPRSDVLHDAVGDFGRWQAGLSVIMALLKIPVAFFQLSILILEAPVQFWCSKPAELLHLSTEQWRNVSQLDSTGRYDACKIYNINYTDSADIGNVTDRTSTIPCQSWQYSKDVITESIVTEWDLVCGQAQLTDIAQATFMFGVLLGNVFFGMAADRFGRKVPLMLAIALQAVCGIATAFMPWYLGFLLFRFILAVATGGTMIISFVLIMEVVGDSWRTTIAILYQVPFCFGISLMAGIAYLQRDWRHFQLTLSALSALFLFYWWCVPESPRWLLAVGRDEEAVTVLEKAARWNRRDVAQVKKIVQYRRLEEKQFQDLQVEKSDLHKANLLDLLRTPNLRRNTICLFLTWFLAGLSFFALSQSMGQLGGSIFVNVTVAGLIGLPGTLTSIYAVKAGRKKAIILSQIVGGLSCLLVIAVPKGTFPGDWPRLCLIGLSLTTLSVNFPALYLFSGEIFPTVVRNVGLGASSMFSRLGSIIAPFVKSLGVYGDFIPLAIVGVSLLIGALVVLLLPETRGCQLPDTIEDGEKFGQRSAEDKRNANYMQVRQEKPDQDVEHDDEEKMGL